MLTVTRLHPGFSGATASIVSVDPRAPQSQRSAVLASDSSGALFPSPQDLAIDCDGIAWVAGYDMGAQVFGVDIGAPMGPRIVRTMPTRTLQPDGKFQGLGLSSDGLLAVGDFWTSEVSLIDVRRGVWRETIDLRNLPGVFRAPQDIAFSSDGARMIVPCASTDTLAVFAR